MTRKQVQLLSVPIIPILVLLILAFLVPTLATASPPSDVEAGKTAFEANCAACHGEGATGGVGPPLGGAFGFFTAYDIPGPVIGGVLIGLVRDGIDGRMPSFSEGKLPDGDVINIGDYLASIAVDASVGAFPGDAAQGADLYVANCQACHGENATGGMTEAGFEAPPLAFMAAFFNQAGLPPQVMYAFVNLVGRFGAPGKMPAFTPDEVSNDDLANIAAYVVSVAPAELPGPPPEPEPPKVGGITLPRTFMVLMGLVGVAAIGGGSFLLRRRTRA